MKTTFKRLLFGALILGALGLTTQQAHARLPKPIQIHVTAVYVDEPTQSVVVKPDNKEKPFVLDWNNETDFIKNGESAVAADIEQGATVVIHYKRVSFRNPLIKKVVWENGKKPEGQQP